MKSRIKKIIETEKLSASDFAKKIGRQRSSVSHILSGRNNPSLDVVQEILTAFNKLEPEWLLFGKGSMYRTVRTQKIFSEKPEEAKQEEIIKPKKIKIAEVKKDETEENENIVETKIKKKKKKKKRKNCRAERILIFNSDRTFIEYYPA